MRTDDSDGNTQHEGGKPCKRVLFIKDGEVFHQLYRGNMTNEELYAKISDTLTILTTGGEHHE